MKRKTLKLILKILTVIVTIVFLGFIIYGLNITIFHDKQVLVDYIDGFGILAPIIFIIIQVIQVVLPVIPGGVSSLAGVIAFGPVYGFIYNYIGIVLGSIAAFYLARSLGVRIIKALFDEKKAQKYLNYISQNKFYPLFVIAMFLPGLPDDLICFVAGTSKMTFKKFLIAIMLCKPVSLILYSFGINLL